MTFVVTDNCRDCRFTDCVTVCPVDCFYGDNFMLYIEPDECIDCGACAPCCPVEAIFYKDDLPDDKRNWLAINASKASTLKNIIEKEKPLCTAEKRKKELGFF